MMNLVFRCMAQDKPGQLLLALCCGIYIPWWFKVFKPGQPHDYAAERKRNDRKPPRPPKGVTVRLGELGGLSAEFIQ